MNRLIKEFLRFTFFVIGYSAWPIFYLIHPVLPFIYLGILTAILSAVLQPRPIFVFLTIMIAFVPAVLLQGFLMARYFVSKCEGMECLVAPLAAAMASFLNFFIIIPSILIGMILGLLIIYFLDKKKGNI